MKKSLTEQDVSSLFIDEARKIVAKANGSIGGRNWWASLNEEQRSERIKKLIGSRKKKKDIDSAAL